MSPADGHDTSQPRRAFAYGLQAIRGVLGGRQEAEAARAGVSWRTWIRWEGVQARARIAKLELVAERWRVPVEDLLVEPTRERLAELRLEQALRGLVADHGARARSGGAGARSVAVDSSKKAVDGRATTATDRSA